MILLGIPGSLRAGSYNLALLRAAAALAPSGCSIDIASLQGIPLYDGDLEKKSGIPPAVQALQKRLAASNGLILATPEYNNSLPGVLKNAIDWLTRPPAEIAKLFRDRPVAVCGAAPGAGGTRLAQLAWLPVLRTLGMRPWFGATLAVATAAKVFDDGGTLRDEKVSEQVLAFVAGFAAFVSRSA